MLSGSEIATKSCLKRRATTAGSTVARLQRDTGTTLLQTSNLIHRIERLLPKTRHDNKETVQQTFKCILMHL